MKVGDRVQDVWYTGTQYKGTVLKIDGEDTTILWDNGITNIYKKIMQQYLKVILDPIDSLIEEIK